MNQLYALHDSQPGHPRGCFPVRRDEALDYNRQGFGIFHTVNNFKGPRQIPNLTKINAWAVDMDGKDRTKEEMWKVIERGLQPTMIIETKSGFHVYWKAKDAIAAHWNAIMLDRLVPFYGADKNARDLARILRTPGFYHQKDPANPFLIRELKPISLRRVSYTERQMARFYPSHALPETPELTQIKREVPKGGTFWDRVFSMDCEYALSILSGHDFVSGETYTFRRNNSGTKNILVNGKSTSCWIDANGRIGSLSGGGPSIYQWLMWFHKNPKKVAGMLATAFPELEGKINEL